MPNSRARRIWASKPRRPDERLGRHAAGVEAVAAHPVVLDQRHLGLHRGRDIGGDETRGTGADHDDVAVEARGSGPARIHALRLDCVQDLLGGERKDAEQRERDEQAGRDAELAELGARVDVDDGAGEHADLAHPQIGPRAHRRQPHREVDGDEGKRRHQPQREEIEGALARHAVVHRLQSSSPNFRCTQSRSRKRDARNASVAPIVEAKETMTVPHTQAENDAPGERQDGGPGQGQAGHRDVDREVDRGRLERDAGDGRPRFLPAATSGSRARCNGPG